MAREFLTSPNLKAPLQVNGATGAIGEVFTSQGPNSPPIWSTPTLAWKANCRTAPGGNVVISSPGSVVGGVTMVAGDRAVLRGQTVGSENGIYVWNGATVPMTRAADADTFAKLQSAMTIITDGSQAGRTYRQTITSGTLGTTPLVWKRYLQEVKYESIGTPPTSYGNHDSISTAFIGDTASITVPVSYLLSGATTLGQPTNGYVYTPERYPHYTYVYSDSGHNNSTSSNAGRTAMCAYRTRVAQYGQGDCMAYNGSVFVNSTKIGSTHFLANPAAGLFTGDGSAGIDGAYLNMYETNCEDSGYDIAAIGIVNNFERTNATGAKSAVWIGYRAQSNGSQPCDSFLSATGKWRVGLDLTCNYLDFSTNKAAISLKANDRIYLNNLDTASGSTEAGWRTTVFNQDYIAYTSATSSIDFVRNGSVALQLTSNGAVLPRVTYAASVITYAATTNLDIATLAGTYQTETLTGNVVFTTSNRASGRKVTLRLVCDATQRTLSFPGWVFVGTAAPTVIAANKTALLILEFFGTADTDCVARYMVEP